MLIKIAGIFPKYKQENSKIQKHKTIIEKMILKKIKMK